MFMINEWRVYRENAWSILSFPKQNKTILYNGTTKEYEFREGIAKPFVKKAKPVPQPNYKLVDMKKYRYMIIFLVAVLGISLGCNVAQYIM